MRPARATLRATVLGLALAWDRLTRKPPRSGSRTTVAAQSCWPSPRAVRLRWRRMPPSWSTRLAPATISPPPSVAATIRRPRALPVIGDGTQPDAERVTAVRPDLIIAWQPAAAEPLVRVMDKLGVPVYYSDPQTLADIPPRWNGWASCSAPRTRLGPPPGAARTAGPAGRAPCRPPAAAGFHPGRAGSHLHAEPDQYRQRRPALVRRRQRLRRLARGGAPGVAGKRAGGPARRRAGGRVAAGRQGEQPRGVAQAGLPAAQAGHVYGIDADALYRPGPA